MSGDSDQMPCSAASYLGRHCLPMSHKKDARLIWVKLMYYMNRSRPKKICLVVPKTKV